MDRSAPNSTPMTSIPTTGAGTPADKQLYQEAIGSINYAAICTQPDISFTIGYLGHFSAETRAEHWVVVKRLLRYLRKTTKLALELGGSETHRRGIVTYADVSFADINLKSTSGYVIFYGRSAVL
jgi:hypothetical protein